MAASHRPGDVEKVEQAYAARGFKAVVQPFLAEMDLALGAATVAVSRAGASSLAEIAAMRLPSLLVPYPAAADNHQFFNAQAFETTGAARLLEQKDATPEKVAALLCELVEAPAARAKMQTALAQWHAPRAAEQIAEMHAGGHRPIPGGSRRRRVPAILFPFRRRCRTRPQKSWSRRAHDADESHFETTDVIGDPDCR